MKTLLLISVFIILLVIETFYAKRELHAPRLKRFCFHLPLSIINTFFTRLTCWSLLLMLLLQTERQGVGLRYVLGISGWFEIVLTVILADLFEYVWHRMNHRIHFLWRFHRAHHTDKDVDLSTALRFHPVELVFSYGYKTLWILLWGPSLEAFLISQTLITLYAMFHHSNFDWPDSIEKWVRIIHMTPRLHTAHHLVDNSTRNANYAVIFAVWDRIFGTLAPSKPGQTEIIGVPGHDSDCLSWKQFYLEPLRQE